jgi:hypothetical protein
MKSEEINHQQDKKLNNVRTLRPHRLHEAIPKPSRR